MLQDSLGVSDVWETWVRESRGFLYFAKQYRRVVMSTGSELPGSAFLALPFTPG